MSLADEEPAAESVQTLHGYLWRPYSQMEDQQQSLHLHMYKALRPLRVVPLSLTVQLTIVPISFEEVLFFS
jgi:hypothetical protein